MRESHHRNSSTKTPMEEKIAVFGLDGTLTCEAYSFCYEYMREKFTVIYGEGVKKGMDAAGM